MSKVIAAFLFLMIVIPVSGMISDERAPMMLYRYADSAEGQELIADNADYFDMMSQMNIAYRVGNEQASEDELIEFAKEQVSDFSEEEKQGINESLKRIRRRFNKVGFDYAFEQEFVFVKTTMLEECHALGYTHKNQIYLDEKVLKWSYTKADTTMFRDWFDELIVHEMFHVLTRNDQDFRKDMYDVIGFKISDTDMYVSDRVRDKVFLNPDDPAFDSYTFFTINGVKKKAVVKGYFPNGYCEYDEKPFENMKTAVIFEDAPNRAYPISRISDFYDVMGHNTEYVISPEECLADNFKYAVLYGIDVHGYDDPEIIEDILDVLEKY